MTSADSSDQSPRRRGSRGTCASDWAFADQALTGLIGFFCAVLSRTTLTRSPSWTVRPLCVPPTCAVWKRTTCGCSRTAGVATAPRSSHGSAAVSLTAPEALHIAVIQGLALKQIEAVRDGTAGQYGSYAIPGVVDIKLPSDAYGPARVGQILSNAKHVIAAQDCSTDTAIVPSVSGRAPFDGVCEQIKRCPTMPAAHQPKSRCTWFTDSGMRS